MKKNIIFILLFCSTFFYSQENLIADKMIQEIQQIKQTNSSLKLVWWIPTEYWQIAMSKQKNVTPDQIKYLNDLFNDYTIIVAGDFSLTEKNAEIEFKVNNVEKSLAFLDENGKKIQPLKESQVDEKVISLMNDILKPLFSQMLGKMGSGVEIFIYNNKTSDGNRILDPFKSGQFKVRVDKELFVWKLPLISLMEEKVCTIDDQKFPGNYVFCPFHGSELTNQ